MHLLSATDVYPLYSPNVHCLRTYFIHKICTYTHKISTLYMHQMWTFCVPSILTRCGLSVSPLYSPDVDFLCPLYTHQMWTFCVPSILTRCAPYTHQSTEGTLRLSHETIYEAFLHPLYSPNVHFLCPSILTRCALSHPSIEHARRPH